MAKNDNKNFIANNKDLEIYFDLIKRKIFQIRNRDQIRIKIVSGKKIKFSTVKPHPLSIMKIAELNNQNNKNTFEVKTEGEVIKSPMVGTAYLSPEPSAPEFIKKVIKLKDALLIVEAMKVMNNISSPKDGFIKKFI